MEFSLFIQSCIAVCMLELLIFADALDIYHLEQAKILTRDELGDQAPSSLTAMFEPSGGNCRDIGEQAARRRVTCVADTAFYDTLVNRVHMTNIDLNSVLLKELAFKISQCSYRHSKYFERGCQATTTYLNDRYHCRRLHTRAQRTKCKGKLRRRYHV